MIIRVQKVRFTPDRKPAPKKVKLGFEGDNMVERLEFDLPTIAESQSVTLMMGGKYANAVSLDLDGEDYYVELTADLVGAEGEIEAYVRIDGADGEVWQSDVMRLITGDVPDVETEIETRYPSAVETMLTEMAEHRAEMEDKTQQAEDAAQRAEDAAERAETTQWLYIGPDEPTDPRVVMWIQTEMGSEGVAFALASDGTVILREVMFEQMDDGTVRMVGTEFGLADDGTVKIGGA